jgi:hypothetical protein
MTIFVILISCPRYLALGLTMLAALGVYAFVLDHA